ncbi:hypothetical protein NP233_g11376 [Leucocoprinus birnbaumii]|uniref:BTB domain-containing protein n=1 Tax=Leucocoprinus birnbaumii TaxID=56174 RepID=A0AAD5VGX1_9AGAR|nr:hypothetical protein NP233_g11376 [Leucocoprinus birnbaumii]
MTSPINPLSAFTRVSLTLSRTAVQPRILAVPTSATPSNQSIVRRSKITDSEYFREDGDCVILVGDVVFKVDKYLLTQDSPIFRTKLAAVDGIKTVSEDGSKAIALVLDDDASSFRDLCWVLSSSPNKLWEFVNYPLTDAVMLRVKKLVRIAAISQKYGFTKTSKWAVYGIATLYEKSWEAKKNLDAHFSCAFEPNNDLLKYFTIAAEFSQNEVMFGKAKQTWVKRIESGHDTPYQALALAQDKGWRHFEGRVYLAILRALTKSNPLSASPPPAPPTFGFSRTEPPVPFLDAWKNAIEKGTLPFGPNTPLTRSLTPDQIARLSNGHLVLTQLQREFVGVSGWHLSLTSFNQFAHRFEASFWEDFWKACVRHATGRQETGAIHGDVFTLMKHMQEFMEDLANGTATLEGFNGSLLKDAGFASNVRAAATLLNRLRDMLLDHLPDFFYIV